MLFRSWCYGTNANLTINNGEYMLGNSVEVFALPPGVTQISVIGKAGGSIFRVHIGQGQ